MTSKRKRVLQPEPGLVLVKRDLGPVSVSDDESEAGGHEAVTAAVLDNDNQSDTLLGLDLSLIESSRAIRNLILEGVSDGPTFCHLRDLPDNAIWSETNTLSVPEPSVHAIILVAFGSLAGFEMVVIRGKAATLTVAVELFGDAEVTKLQQIFDLAQSSEVATREVIAVRVSAGPRSRLLNVHDRSGRTLSKARVVPLGVNELLGGDVVRLVMRCVRVKQGDGFRVEFKLKSLSLFFPVPRTHDIM